MSWLRCRECLQVAFLRIVVLSVDFEHLELPENDSRDRDALSRTLETPIREGRDAGRLTVKEGMPPTIHLGRGFERSAAIKTARPIEAAT